MIQQNNQIMEVIVTSLSHSGLPYTAPMGVIEVDTGFLIKPFKPSTTYDNLKSHHQCVINYTDDVQVFAGSLTGRHDWPTLPCQKIRGQYLKQALAHIELDIINFIDSEPRACFTGKIVAQANHAPFRGFNRAQSAVIEAAILTSRMHILPPEKIQQEIRYLTIAIEKTAGERELEAWGWLITKIKETGINLSND